MKKKLLALLLATAMVATLFAGCGGNEEPDNSENKGSEVVGDTDESESEEEQEEPDEIVIALMCTAPMDQSITDHVEEAINEMLLEKVNVKADIMWFQAADYGQKVPMMLQGGEQIDLMMMTPVPSASYASFLTAGQLMDIAPYLDEYGQGIKEAMGDYLGATSVGDATYAVGNLASLYGFLAINMRADVLRDLGLYEQAAAIKSWDDYEAILEEVVAKTDYAGVSNSDAEGTIITCQPFMVGTGAFADAYWVDTIGDGYQYTYVDAETNTVKCYFENPAFMSAVKEMGEWNKKGLIYEDAHTTDEYGAALIKSGVSFSYLAAGELGGAATVASNAGCEILQIEVTPRLVGTAAFQKFGFCVPVTSDYPEAAIKVLNLLFTDKEVVDTFTWGVKGVDWVEKDGLATYPEGADAQSVYHTGDFLYGNVLNITPWEGNAADIREQQAEANKNAAASKYIGCALDTSTVATEIAAVKDIVDRYKEGLCSGVTDYEAEYQKFIDAIYAAGMQDIINEFQAQLDAWLAN